MYSRLLFLYPLWKHSFGRMAGDLPQVARRLKRSRPATTSGRVQPAPSGRPMVPLKAAAETFLKVSSASLTDVDWARHPLERDSLKQMSQGEGLSRW